MAASFVGVLFVPVVPSEPEEEAEEDEADEELPSLGFDVDAAVDDVPDPAGDDRESVV